MEFFSVKVECHSGYKADEYPTKFIWDNIEFDVIEVIDRWHEGYDKSSQESINYFRVRTDLKGNFLLKHEIENDLWFLVV